MDRTVPSNCLGQTSETRCTKWSGKDYPELDIKTGDSLEWVLDKIVSALGTSTIADTETVDLSCLESSGVSECAASITARNLLITTSSSTGGVQISWNSDSIRNQINATSGYSIIGASVTIFAQDGTIQYSGSSATALTSVMLSRFPVTMDYSLFLHTPCGQVRLQGSIPIDANPKTITPTLDLIDVVSAASSVNNIVEAVELLAREVCDIKNRI